MVSLKASLILAYLSTLEKAFISLSMLTILLELQMTIPAWTGLKESRVPALLLRLWGRFQ
jgi:hypothetical protein